VMVGAVEECPNRVACLGDDCAELVQGQADSRPTQWCKGMGACVYAGQRVVISLTDVFRWVSSVLFASIRCWSNFACSAR